jgi:hypothetical protein
MFFRGSDVLRGRGPRALGVVALAGTAAHLVGPVLAGGLAAPLLRLAMGQAPSPAVGALEAGLLAARDTACSTT